MKARVPQIRTADQKRAFVREANLQLAETMRGFEEDFLAYAVYSIRLEAGWGKKRLTRYLKRLRTMFADLVNHYEMDNAGMYLAKVKLRELGVDVTVDKNEIFDFNLL